jgi:glycosyltransferase involved in cell wall biosynthesis
MDRRKAGKMRIAHIAPAWITIPPQNYGGTENVIYNLIEEQVAQGNSVTLLAPEDASTSGAHVSFFARSLLECGVPWQSHLKAFYHLYKSIDYLKKHILEFDIVHTHLSSPSDMYVFPLLETLALPYVTTLHSQFPFDHISTRWRGDADYCYMEWLAKTPMVAISESARRQEQEKFPLNFVAVIHHGINFRDFPRPVKQAEDFFVWLGRLTPEKGAHLAIEACRRAGARLILAGIVDDHVPKAQHYFHSEIEPHIDGQQIQYIGPVDSSTRNELLRKARALLNPLQWEEPFGMVMLEAMATGCPVIAYQRGAAPEIVANERVGFLVQNIEEMMERMSCVHTIQREEVRTYAEEHFSGQLMAKKYLKVYKDACGKDTRSLRQIPAGIINTFSRIDEKNRLTRQDSLLHLKSQRGQLAEDV